MISKDQRLERGPVSTSHGHCPNIYSCKIVSIRIITAITPVVFNYFLQKSSFALSKREKRSRNENENVRNRNKIEPEKDHQENTDKF